MKSGVRRALKLRNAATPVPMGGSGFYKLPLGAGSDTDETYLRAYGTQGTVFANVSLLTSSTAKPEWRLYRKAKADGRVRFTTSDQGSDQRTEVVQHQALNVLARPSVITSRGIEITWHTRFSLFELSQTYMELAGRSHWIVGRDPRSSIPLSLWPVRPDRMTPVPDPHDWLRGWVYTSPDGREKVPLYPDEVIFNRYPDPLDPYGGLGPVQSVLTDIDGARYAAEWNRNFFVNSAEPGGVIQVDHEMDDDEWNTLESRWREAHRGVSRAHRVAVLENGQSWVQNSHSLRDMDFANLRQTSRDIIREALGMHKVMTGVTEDVNRANAQTGQEVFAQWKVAPRLDRWKDVLNHQFLPLFGASGEGVEFDYVFPMPLNREQDNAELTAKCQSLATLVGAGFDPDEACEVVGLPVMAVVEKATQAPALPPGWVPEQPAAPAVPEGDAMENLRRQVAIWNAVPA